MDCRLFYVCIMAYTLEIIIYPSLLLALSIVTSVLLVYTAVGIICHHNSAVFVLTHNAPPLLFFLTASDRGLRLSGAQRYLMDNPALLQVLKSVRLAIVTDAVQ